MNSLSELNFWNQGQTVEFEDVRLATVVFDLPAVTNQSKVVNEGSEFASPVGINIEEVVNADVATPTFSLDITGAPEGTTVEWPDVPSGCEVTNLGPIYTIDNVNSAEIWQRIKAPTIVLPATVPDAYYGTFNYSCTINFIDEISGPRSRTWTVTVTVLDVTILNTPLEFVYNTNTLTPVTTPPNIEYDEWPGVTWTLTGTPSSTVSITTWASSATGTGGTFSVNATSKVFTITGTTAQVNALMDGLNLSSNTVTSDFSVYYLLTNNQGSASDTKTQLFKNADTRLFSNPTTTTPFYPEDEASFTVSGGPQITDLSYVGSGSYTVVLSFSNSSVVTAMSAGGTGGTASYNNTNKTLTITGTKSQVNTRLQEITISFVNDFSDNNILLYTLTTPLTETTTKAQTLICNTNDTELSNMFVTRSYVSNNSNLIFATNTPQIIDLDTDPENIYSVSLSSTFGGWGRGSELASNPYTVTGTRDQVNALIAGIKFYPNFGISSNGTFTYTFIKNNVTQFTQNAPLTGSVGTYNGARTETFTTTRFWTPTAEDVKYAKFDLLVVGGGGGGGRVNISGPTYGGGGGAGGAVNTWTNLLFEPKTYTVTVGTGGPEYNPTQVSQTNVEYRANGSASSFDIYLAEGGQGAVRVFGSSDPQTAMRGASTAFYNGGTAVVKSSGDSYERSSGGGASVQGPGENAVANSYPPSGLVRGKAGNGADGKLVTLFGTNEYYGGGGGGSVQRLNTDLPNQGLGGIGGGGDGGSASSSISDNGENGEPNTGGGGGGTINGLAGGGSGVIKIKIKAR
jgi:hypothetical protein